MPRGARWAGRHAHIAQDLVYNWHEASTPETCFFRGVTQMAGLPVGLVEDLQALSVNDWYGWGVLVGLGLEQPMADAEIRRAWTYGGRSACHNSYLQGIRDGRAMKRASPVKVLALDELPPLEQLVR